MPSYSLNSLIVFHKVVKLGSFSKAAEALFMTQPGVSNHVAQLELQTGLKLLDRERGRIELTREGRTVFKYAEKIEKAARELESAIMGMQKDARPLLKVGTTPTYSRIMMPHVLGAFQKTNPDILIKLDTGSSGEMVQSLLSNKNDITIAVNPALSKKLASFPFHREELMLITSHDHPLAKRHTIALDDIKPYPLLIREEGSATRSVVLDALAVQNIKPSVLIEAKSTEFIKEWVSRGKGISILIRRAIQDHENNFLTVVPLVDPLYLEISVIFLKSRRNDPSIKRFVEYVRELRL
jgi:DNA-binding transcriptional LysR family regulator